MSNTHLTECFDAWQSKFLHMYIQFIFYYYYYYSYLITYKIYIQKNKKLNIDVNRRTHNWTVWRKQEKKKLLSIFLQKFIFFLNTKQIINLHDCQLIRDLKEKAKHFFFVKNLHTYSGSSKWKYIGIWSNTVREYLILVS